MDRKQIRAEIILVTIIWGGTFAMIKTGLDDASPLIFLSVRFGASFLLFSLFFFRKFRFKGIESLINGIVLGVFMFIGYAAQTVGLAYTTASKAGFITYTFALFVPFLQIRILKRKPLMGNIIGLIVVFVGLWMISNPTGGAFNVGDFIMLIAAVSYAFYIVLLDLITKEESPELMTAIQFFTTSLLSLIASFFLEESKLQFSPTFLFSLAYLVILGSVFCLYMMNRYQRDTTPMRAVLIYSLEPVFGVLFAIILLGENLSPGEIAGSLIILAGVFLSELWEILPIGKNRT